MKFTYHKTYYFKMENSVVLSILTKLCNYHHFLIAEYFHHPQRNSMLTQLHPIPPPSYPTTSSPTTLLSHHPPIPVRSGNHCCVSVSVNLPFLDNPCGWNHAIRCVQSLASSTLHNVCEIHSCISNLIPLFFYLESFAILHRDN